MFPSGVSQPTAGDLVLRLARTRLPALRSAVIFAWLSFLVFPVSLPASETNAWWAVKPLAKPMVAGRAGQSGCNPVDAFIESGLERKGLSAAPQAERQSLLRRVYF